MGSSGAGGGPELSVRSILPVSEPGPAPGTPDTPGAPERLAYWPGPRRPVEGGMSSLLAQRSHTLLALICSVLEVGGGGAPGPRNPPLGTRFRFTVHMPAHKGLDTIHPYGIAEERGQKTRGAMAQFGGTRCVLGGNERKISCTRNGIYGQNF